MKRKRSIIIRDFVLYIIIVAAIISGEVAIILTSGERLAGTTITGLFTVVAALSVGLYINIKNFKKELEEYDEKKDS